MISGQGSYFILSSCVFNHVLCKNLKYNEKHVVLLLTPTYKLVGLGSLSPCTENSNPYPQYNYYLTCLPYCIIIKPTYKLVGSGWVGLGWVWLGWVWLGWVPCCPALKLQIQSHNNITTTWLACPSGNPAMCPSCPTKPTTHNNEAKLAPHFTNIWKHLNKLLPPYVAISSLIFCLSLK